MPPSSILLLLSAAFRITNALPWAGPEPTIVYQADEWSPVPTQIRVDPKELFRRTNVDVAVCGWLGGDKDNPAVCPTGSSCIHDWAHGYVGCCATVGSCTAGVYTSCVDKNSLGGTTGPVVVNNGVFTCPSDSLCYKNTYPGNYFQWACGSTDQATAVETSYDGQPTDLLLQVVYTRMAFSPITLPSTTSSSPSSTAIPAITSNTGSASTTRYPNANAAGASAGSSSTTSPVEDNSGKKINGGIVAAGVVATGAFIIVLVGIVFFFLRRRKNQQEQGSPSAGGGGGGPFRSFKGGEVPHSPASTQATFPRAVAYSPDDFRTNASTNTTSPPLDPSRSVFSATEYQGIEQRLRDNLTLAPSQPHYTSPSLNNDGVPESTEIADFSHSFHAAIAQISPQNRLQAQMNDMIPPSSRSYASHGPEKSAGIAMGAIAAGNSRRESHARGYDSRGYGPVEDDDYEAQSSYLPGDDRTYVAAAPDEDEWDERIEEDEDDRPIDAYDPISKELGVATGVKAPPSYSPVPGFRSENVRVEGLEPPGLRPTRDLTPPATASPIRDSTPRYQLVDQPPSKGVKILHSAGQLRGQAKASRQKQSYDGKNGDDLQA